MMISNKHKALGGLLLAVLQGPVLAAETLSCEGPSTLISAIQGSGQASPLVDQQVVDQQVVVKVVVKAVVSAVYAGLGGYYLQQPANQWDDNSATSEGIFVFDNTQTPKVGDLVALAATVAEEKDLTQLSHTQLSHTQLSRTQLGKVTGLKVCSQGHKVEPLTVKLPVANSAQWEALEGMLVSFPQELTISENYNRVRFGQLLLSNGRLYKATNLVKPGRAANEYEAANQLNQITLDDGSNAKNPALNLDSNPLFRTGNTVTGVQGVVHFSFGRYMIEPTAEPQYIASNPRPSKPPLKNASKAGQLRVASFNVLNYFNGEGDDKKFPTKRGANSKAEFDRQNAKIIAAMKIIDADVFGLMEVENDGYGPNSAIAELTHNLAVASGKNYVFVQPASAQLGSDHIAVGMIYNADKLEVKGAAQTITEAPFDHHSRQPLAQTFKTKAAGEVFTLVVNHFKSKGSCPKEKADPNGDQGDGQGCWNLTRVESALKLVQWLKSDPTASGDKDVLIIGDLNANAKEQPVTTLTDNGFVNMVAKYQGDQAYSFVYKGEAGTLDHALASSSLAAKIVDAADWHINADEMQATDYNVEHKSELQKQQWYQVDPFRSSDHDPMIIELGF